MIYIYDGLIQTIDCVEVFSRGTHNELTDNLSNPMCVSSQQITNNDDGTSKSKRTRPDAVFMDVRPNQRTIKRVKGILDCVGLPAGWISWLTPKPHNFMSDCVSRYVFPGSPCHCRALDQFLAANLGDRRTVLATSFSKPRLRRRMVVIWPEPTILTRTMWVK